MCTRVLWSGAHGAVLVGRNMDYHRDTETDLWKLPRGVKRDDCASGELTWTSKYGSVIAAGFDIVALDGMNEAGLGGHLLVLAESTYGTRDASRPGLGLAVWLQYYFDNFATVAEAVRWTEQSRVQVVPVTDPATGESPVLHMALEDATGDSAIIEYIDGDARIYHHRDYRVLTNSPTYDRQLALAARITGLGGSAPIPGSTLASDRFGRASYYLTRLPEVKSQVEAIAAIFSVIRNAAQPFRVPDPGHPEASQTIWQAVADLTNKRYVFESTTRPNTVWVDLDDLDFGEGSKELRLDLRSGLAIQGGVAGNVSDKFEDRGSIHFLAISKVLAEKSPATAAKRAQ